MSGNTIKYKFVTIKYCEQHSAFNGSTLPQLTGKWPQKDSLNSFTCTVTRPYATFVILTTTKVKKKCISYGRKSKHLEYPTLRSHDEGEYVNGNFESYLEEGGITLPHTKQRNGAAERANHSLIEITRSMMLVSGLLAIEND
uniref:Integrase catalytic domain-containing protein n=1 Tax=Glossina pallidipes TaxID=7398 RepID=A0A1B0A770_GLOPL